MSYSLQINHLLRPGLPMPADNLLFLDGLVFESRKLNGLKYITQLKIQPNKVFFDPLFSYLKYEIQKVSNLKQNVELRLTLRLSNFIVREKGKKSRLFN